MSNVVSFPPGFQIRLMGRNYNAPLAISDWVDSFGQGNSNTIYFDIHTRKDFVVRVRRDVSGHSLNAELWNADGSDYVFQRLAIERFDSKPLSGDGEIGGKDTVCSLAYLSWTTKLAPVGTSPFRNTEADLAAWDFESKLANTGPVSLRMYGEGKPVFVNTPGYPPFVTQGESRVLRAGVPQKLDGRSSHSLADNRPLSYEWSEVSGPSALRWDSQTSATPTVDGLVFGSYQIRLRATDSSGQSSTSTVKYGAVRTDDHDVVINDDPNVTKLLGPMLRLGANPWPYFDRRHRGLADFFGGLQDKQYAESWNTALRGSIILKKGSTLVTGRDTAFRSDLCSAAEGQSNATLVVWYAIAGANGKTGHRPYEVASCESDTVLRLKQAYAQADGGGLKYSRMDESAVGTWINGSTNANYYDNVLAFYSLYYRSGIDDYLKFARTLADRWWDMPWIDGGRSASDDNGSTYLFPRVKALTGLVARALDGRPEMWSGLRALADSDYGVWLNKREMADMREEAYATAYASLIALFDPDAASRAKHKAAVLRALNTHWAPNQLADKSWKNPSFGYASWNGSKGTVKVEQGSTRVVGTGTEWRSEWFTNNAFWTANGDQSHGDRTAYTPRYVSSTELALDRPYEGPTASGRAWQLSNIVGSGTEPFLLGLVAGAFRYAYAATDDPRPRQFLIDIAEWITREGIRPSTRGLWYARGFPNCEPIRDGNQWCASESIDESRALAGPVVNAYSWAYILSKNPAIKAAGDRLYGAMYGKDGGADSDGHYVRAIDAGEWDEQVKKAKDFGFFFGWGFGACWPAARLTE